MNRRVLIVSPHFPPVNAPDMQRVRMSLPGFLAAGWEVTVLTVDDPTPSAPVEPGLLATVPAAVRVIRATCLSRHWTRWLGVGNVALRALPFLFLAGHRALAGRRHDVVYFSTTMFIILPFGRIWRWLHGTPYVIDLQDPWVTDYYDRPGAPRPPGGWKYPMTQWIGRHLERWSFRHLSHLITVSADYAGVLRTRYPELTGLPATEIPFGPPETDLAFLRATLPVRPRLLPTTGFTLAFAGALGPGMLDAVDRLFAALAVLRREGLKISIHFYGTSYAPGREARLATRVLAERHGVTGCVHEQAGRLPYLAALQVTLEAGANLILGSTDLAFTPSKILAVQAARRPVLALGYTNSALARRLKQLGLPCVLLDSGDTPDTLIQALRTLATAAAIPPPLPPAFRADALARAQLDILSGVIAART